MTKRYITLKKFYAKIKSRDTDNSFFTIIYKDLSFFAKTGFLIILAPTVVVTSLLSQTTILLFANIFLALGFLYQFAHRLYFGEMSYIEVLLSFIMIALLILLAFYLSPVISFSSFLGVLCFINLVASSINSFFLIRTVVIPPLMMLIQKLCHVFGYQISISFLNVRPLTLETDRCNIDKLLSANYGHDSFSPSFRNDEIKPFNQRIAFLCDYINKQENVPLGQINNDDKISAADKALKKLVYEGKTDLNGEFIRGKISSRVTKIRTLHVHQKKLWEESHKEIPQFSIADMHAFFSGLRKEDENNKEAIIHCATLIATEIKKQKSKYDRLLLCAIPKDLDNILPGDRREAVDEALSLANQISPSCS